jgi:hypothetical protein
MRHLGCRGAVGVVRIRPGVVGSSAGRRERRGREEMTEENQGGRRSGGCGPEPRGDGFRDEFGRAQLRSSNRASQPGRAESLYSYQPGSAEMSKPV